MQSVSTFFKEERDFLYKRGEKKAEAKALEEKKELVKELAFEMKRDGEPTSKIMKYTKLSLEEIQAL